MLSDSAARRTDVVSDADVVSDEDRLRADLYRLLARFLTCPPGDADLQWAAALEGGPTPLGKAVHALSRVAAQISQSAADDEYHALFIGVGRGELLPYGSYYLTGFLHEKPLARLRADMATLGIGANPDATEPEDHAAAILDMMAGLIDGSFGPSASLEQQKAFYDAHAGSWMPLFFRDLAAAPSSVLYAALADVGGRFLEIEAAAFAMD